MRRAVSCAAPFSLAIALSLMLPAGAEARLLTYIASTGNDDAACTRRAPCRTLQRGVDAATPGGEVHILDPGPYRNQVLIEKSVTISAAGASATLVAPGAIVIDNPTASVVLRRLVLKGGNNRPVGIAVSAARSVDLVRCVVERFNGSGVVVRSEGTHTFVSNSTFRGNGDDGLSVTGLDADASVTVELSRFRNNGSDGLEVRNASAVVTGSTFLGNNEDGVDLARAKMVVLRSRASGNANGYKVGNGGHMTLESVAATRNSVGLRVGDGAAAYIANSAVTENQTGISNGGVTETRGNTIAGNGTNATGNPLTPDPGV